MYDADGKAIESADQEESGDALKIRAKAKDLYMNLYRLEQLSLKQAAEQAAAPADK